VAQAQRFLLDRAAPATASGRSFCPTVEPLEERTVLSIALFGVPTWVAQAVGSRLELLKKFLA
jgi:hypothetical protein